MKDFISNTVLLLSAVIVSFLAAEFVTRQFFDPVDYLLPELENDEYLIHRITSGSGGHDEWGFRNYQRPTSVEIVAIGDSQTYGISALSSQSWPAQLAKFSGRSTYNMSLGGYGALQYLYLLKSRALELQPETVIVGLYFGNDFLDAYNLAYSSDNWAQYRNPGFGGEEAAQSKVVVTPEADRFLGWLRDWLAHNSVIYRLVSQSTLGDRVRDSELESGQANVIDLEIEGIRQTFLPGRRLKAVNRQSSKVREGLRISKLAIGEISAVCAADQIQLLVVLIPTKELVYAELVEKKFRESMNAVFQSLVENENYLRAEILEFLTAENITFVDVLPALATSARNGENIYPFNDGHPNGLGYAVIAEEILARGF